MPKKLRDKPFVWPSWISKLVAGESQCEWQFWFKSHFMYDKKPSDFNLARWTVDHNQLLRSRREELEKLDFTVYIEDQNSFKLNMKDIVISGKADIVAISELVPTVGRMYIVEDCKTGNPKTSDHIQVVLYMLFLPISIEKYKGVEFDGCIVYKAGVSNMEIPASAAQDTELKRYIWDTIKRITGAVGCRKVPSQKECSWCDIPKEDCNMRVE